MIKVTFLSNPFDTDKKQILEANYIALQNVQGYVKCFTDNYLGTEFHISINGHILTNDEIRTLYPVDGDQLLIIPVVGKGLKDILRSVATMALMAYAGSLSLGKSWFINALAKGAVMYVGGRIINAILPPPKQNLNSSSTTTSPTYGWSGAKPIAATGTPIGKTFGKVKPALVVLARHITTDGDKQYLNVLYGGGEGPIDSINDITIEGNPIANYNDVQVDIRLGTNDQEPIPNFGDTFADQSLNYELQKYSNWKANTNYSIDDKIEVNDTLYSCSTAGNSGSTQPTWPTSGTVTDGTVVWIYLGSKWATQQTEGNAGCGLEITIELPYGLYHTNDDGSLGNATVDITSEYRKVGDITWKSWVSKSYISSTSISGATCYDTAPEETWTITVRSWVGSVITVKGSVSGSTTLDSSDNVVDNGKIKINIPSAPGTYTIVVNKDYSITAAKNTAVRRTFKLNGLDPAQYEVRCKCTYKSGTDTRYSTRVYWSQLSHVMYNDFARPNKVLLGIKALATDQLSGSDPDIGCTQTRSNVNVWNPSTSQYEQKPATNPYWACYDLIHNCKYLKNINTGQYEYLVEGNPVSRIDYPAFLENANYSAELDSSGDPRFELNLFLDTEISFWDALARVAVVGRGVIIPKGTKYSCICDKPAIPTQLFTMGNITEKSLKGKFQSTKDRSQCIEVDFFNELKDYKQDLAMYFGDDWNTTDRVPNPTKVTRYGISKYKYAYREAIFLYKGNEYLKRTVNWEADIDAIACKPGDVVLLQHDVPKWGAAGGRIVEATANTVTLDKQVMLQPGRIYAVEIRLLNDSRVNKTVVAVNEETITDTLVLTTQFTDIPKKYDVFAFGESYKVTKPFKVINIVKSKDLQCKLSGVEYIEDMYSDIVDIPVVNYSSFDNTLAEVTKLSLGQETYRQKDGVIVSVIHCSWILPRDKNIKEIVIWYRNVNSQTWLRYSKPSGNYTTIMGLKSLESYVVKICTINEVGIISPGIISAPIYITGKDAPPSNITGLLATISTTDSTKINLTWQEATDIDLKGYRVMEGSTVLTPTPITDVQYVYTANSSRQHVFKVYAVDNSGNLSITPATTTISITTEPAQVAGFSITPLDSDRSRLRMQWTANAETDISYYEIRVGEAGWDTASLVATQLKATLFECTLFGAGSITYLIKAVNVAGKYSANATDVTQQYTLTPNTPASGTIVQDANDRTTLLITWLPIADKDLSQYECKLGTDWSTGVALPSTKETTIRYKISASGSYKFMIKSKNVGGYYSSALNLSIQASVEAMDVTGFTAVQSISDHSKVRLYWDQPSALDVAYFEIKKGITWDAGTIVGQRVTGTFYDVVVTDETAQTYWIKAVNVGGKYSQNPASVMGIYNLNPSAPTNLVVTQNPNDRSELIITWAGIPELDLNEYQLKCGLIWETADFVTKTKELNTTYKPSVSGDYKFMLKAKNNSDFYSDEVFTHFYATLEPSDVTNFQASQNGENVLLTWTKVVDADVVGYEVREGSTFENGSVIQTGITMAMYQFAVDTEITRKFHVKAINRAGRYSQTAPTSSVTIANLLPKNVINTYDEIDLATGIHTNTEFGTSLFSFATLPGKFSDYPTTKFSDIGGASVLKLKQRNLFGVNARSFIGGVAYSSAVITITQDQTVEDWNTAKATRIQSSGGTSTLKYRLYANGSNIVGEYYTLSVKMKNQGTTTVNVYLTTGNNTTTTSVLAGESKIVTLTKTGGTTISSIEMRLYCLLATDSIDVVAFEPQIEVGSTATPYGSYFSSGEYLVQRKDLSATITGNIATIFQPSILFTAGTMATLQFRTSKDNAIWTDWINFAPIQATFRYVDFRVLLATEDTAKTPEVNQFTIRVDVPDYSGRKLATIAVGGTDIAYDHTYYQQVFPLPTSIGLGLKAELVSYTLSSATVRIVNIGGTDVGGQAILDYTGY